MKVSSPPSPGCRKGPSKSLQSHSFSIRSSCSLGPSLLITSNCLRQPGQSGKGSLAQAGGGAPMSSLTAWQTQDALGARGCGPVACHPPPESPTPTKWEPQPALGLGMTRNPQVWPQMRHKQIPQWPAIVPCPGTIKHVPCGLCYLAFLSGSLLPREKGQATLTVDVLGL